MRQTATCADLTDEAKIIYASSIYEGGGILIIPEAIYKLVVQESLNKMDDPNAFLDDASDIEDECDICLWRSWAYLWKIPAGYLDVCTRHYESFPERTHPILAPGYSGEDAPEQKHFVLALKIQFDSPESVWDY